jgi:D-alanyl-D-alanine carboxypeptidase
VVTKTFRQHFNSRIGLAAVALSVIAAASVPPAAGQAAGSDSVRSGAAPTGACTLARGLGLRASANADPTDNFSPKIQAELSRTLSDAMKAGCVPGAIVGVWLGRQSWIVASGLGDVATDTPMRLDDRFRIASNTKAVVATAVLRLVDQGRIGLDDPISHYVSGVPEGDRITIRMLLQHTSGLRDYYTDTFNQKVLAHPLRSYTPKQLLARGFAEGLQFTPPGSGWWYSNTGYVLLGRVIQRVTHLSLGAALEREIFGPLGLRHTALAINSSLVGRHSHGYVTVPGRDGLTDITALSPSIAWAAGAVTSDLADVRRLAAAIGDGTLLTGTTQQTRLKTVPIGGPAYVGYGLGLIVVNDFFGHDGEIPGYISVMMRSPSEDATIVLMMNNSDGSPSAPGADAALALFAHLAKVIIPDEPWNG